MLLTDLVLSHLSRPRQGRAQWQDFSLTIKLFSCKSLVRIYTLFCVYHSQSYSVGSDVLAIFVYQDHISKISLITECCWKTWFLFYFWTSILLRKQITELTLFLRVAKLFSKQKILNCYGTQIIGDHDNWDYKIHFSPPLYSIFNIVLPMSIKTLEGRAHYQANFQLLQIASANVFVCPSDKQKVLFTNNKNITKKIHIINNNFTL